MTKIEKLNKRILELEKALVRAKEEIIELTDAHTNANKIFYPKWIDKLLKSGNPSVYVSK